MDIHTYTRDAQLEAAAAGLDLADQAALEAELLADDAAGRAPVPAFVAAWATDEDMLAENDQMSKRRALMSRCLTFLDQREQHILINRRLRDDPPTLDALSQEHGISRERVRQIEVRAFEKLKRIMRSPDMPTAYAA